MKNYVFLIASIDNYEAVEDMIRAYLEGEMKFVSAYPFGVPAEASALIPDIAIYIGRGLAFSNGWCMDGTLSILLGE